MWRSNIPSWPSWTTDHCTVTRGTKSRHSSHYSLRKPSALTNVTRIRQLCFEQLWGHWHHTLVISKPWRVLGWNPCVLFFENLNNLISKLKASKSPGRKTLCFTTGPWSTCHTVMARASRGIPWSVTWWNCCDYSAHQCTLGSWSAIGDRVGSWQRRHSWWHALLQMSTWYHWPPGFKGQDLHFKGRKLPGISSVWLTCDLSTSEHP